MKKTVYVQKQIEDDKWETVAIGPCKNKRQVIRNYLKNKIENKQKHQDRVVMRYGSVCEVYDGVRLPKENK